MGEIGLPRREVLYELRWWEVRAILRGYNRRHRDAWSIARWQTYHLMCVSGADLKGAGILTPMDLIRFPWEDADSPETDDNPAGMPSAEEIERLRELMRQENAAIDEGKPAT